MQTTITGTIKNPKGQNLINVKVRFFLVESGYINGIVYPANFDVETYSDTNGNFSINVWNNTDAAARYKIEFYDNGTLIDSFLAYVPVKPSVSIDEVRTYSGVVGIAPTPIYADLSTAITALNQRLEEINISGTGIDTSQYFNKTDSDARYYQKTESDSRYYSKAQVDNLFGVTPSAYNVTASQTTFTLPSTDLVASVKVNGFEMESSLYSVSGTTLTFPNLNTGDYVQVLQQGARTGIVREEFTTTTTGTSVFTLSSAGNVFSVSVDGIALEPSLWTQSPTTLTIPNLESGSKVITIRIRSL
ncbi:MULTISPECIES: hypothetical protein [Deinococcus]|uniref:Uncharacterized protein n=1 Tax=Deinococcus rufus TaxID=2136097 RepID=A0ABV7Z6M4_9DEIO|nr:hypothetical protein [Deinococcus sp. AB2017081]WQE94432.1 hypothetical protein U2P90_13585 [Deinococcus sp. AB2017081]